MTQKEAILEIHDRVRQCFTRHKFKTFGNALAWLHKTDYNIKEMEAGEQGVRKFSSDILWLISIFGPTNPVDYKVMTTQKVPTLKPVKEKLDENDQPKTSRPKRTKSRRRRF